MSVRIGHRGDRWVELGAWHAVGGEALRFCDSGGALLFLREQVTPLDLRALRRLLTAEDAMTPRLDDAVVLRLVAHRLQLRTLKAVAGQERRRSFVGRKPVWTPPRIELPAPAPRESAPVVELPAVESPPTVAPTPGVAADAQALTLREAAREGTPFCEICEPKPVRKASQTPPDRATSQPPPARKASQRSPADERSSAAPQSATDELFPADSNAVAQARTLRSAARDGAPFCELCRK